jgi:hypothetical protein
MVDLRNEVATILQKGGGVELVFQGTQGVMNLRMLHYQLMKIYLIVLNYFLMNLV